MHLLALDGVYVRDGQRDDDPLVFHELGEPTAAEVAEVAGRTAAGIAKVLREHGRELDPELGVVDVASDTEGDESSALTTCYAAAAAGTDLFGERAGSPALRLVDPSAARPHEPVAIVSGIKVHAKVRVHGNDRAQLERLCRYLARPPSATERLTRMPDGRLRYELTGRLRRLGSQGLADRLPALTPSSLLDSVHSGSSACGRMARERSSWPRSTSWHASLR